MDYEEVKSIADIFSGTYSRLTDGLNHITLKNGWQVLADLEYSSFIVESKPSELLEFEGRICPSNIYRQDGQEYFLCACGKKHITNLTIMAYEHQNFEYILLGSECIKTAVKFLERIEGIEDFKEKVSQWLYYIKEEEKKIKNKKCVACGKYKVKKNYKYKNEARFKWCNDCCSGGQVRCITCNEFRIFKNDWKGNPMLQCSRCYFA